MKVDKYSVSGDVLGQVELPDDVFNADVNDVLIYEYMKVANGNLSQGTRGTKERSVVRGGGAKPWRQKGTGRARAGSSRSPIWVGGGTVFGPRPRVASAQLPKKMRKSAFISILSLKAKNGSVKVLEDFVVDTGKTKDVAEIGKALSVSKGVLVSGKPDGDDSMLKRAMRNIPWFKYNNVSRLSGRDIFYSKELLITESAVKYLSEKFGKVK